MSIFDVIVIGRGLIGSAVARHLALNGAQVCLVGLGEPADHRTHTGVFGSHYDSGRIVRILAPISLQLGRFQTRLRLSKARLNIGNRSAICALLPGEQLPSAVAHEVKSVTVLYLAERGYRKVLTTYSRINDGEFLGDNCFGTMGVATLIVVSKLSRVCYS